MGWMTCAACSRYYNGGTGGCTNAACRLYQPAAALRPPPASAFAAPRPAAGSAPARKAPAIPSEAILASPAPARFPVAAPAPTGSPGPVAIPQAEIAAALAARQIRVDEDGKCFVYRGDSRKPEQIVAAQGFAAWTPLTPDQARRLIRRTQDPSTVVDFFPKKGTANRFNVAYASGPRIDTTSLMRDIKLEKANDTYHVSTDPTADCGGYTSGYIYKIELSDMSYLDHRGQDLRPVRRGLHSGIRASVVFDGADFETATTIGLAQNGNAGLEVAFLTGVSHRLIKTYRPPRSSSEQPFPGSPS